MLHKHSFSILCGHLNLNQKKKKKLNLAGYHSNRLVTGQTGPVTDGLVNLGRRRLTQLVGPIFLNRA